MPAQGSSAVTTINLRGLGATRTLVLVNGRRHVVTENTGVDVSFMPQAALGRTEVLKDGVAALYGWRLRRADSLRLAVSYSNRERKSETPDTAGVGGCQYYTRSRMRSSSRGSTVPPIPSSTQTSPTVLNWISG